MFNRDRAQESSPDIYANLPGYLLRFGGFILSLAMLGLGIILGRQIFIAVGFVILTATFFLFWAARWTTSRLYDGDQLQIMEFLYGLSQARPEDKLAIIDLGLGAPAIALSRHLTTGHLTVFDVFNPQLTGGKELARARRRVTHFPTDPRLVRIDSRIDLLPLPDRSVSAVFLPLILSEFTQDGDRQTLLREVSRILHPNGRLLCAEQNSSWLNWLSLGPGTSRLQPLDYWQRLFKNAGFEILRQEEINGLTICIRADKPSPFAGKQLSLGLQFEETAKNPRKNSGF